MNKRNLALAAAVSAALCAPATTASAGEMEWFGAVYAKFLDGDRRFESALYNNAETTPGEAGGDQGQGIEFELMFRNQVSKQVEISGRLKARFNKNFWTNFGGFGPEENDERSAQYVKMRGVRAVITPGYEWIDSATIGSNDFGMFDAMTQGKYRYIDRDNASGLLFQGSAVGNDLRWDLARVSLPRLFAGPAFVTRGEDDALKLETNDAAYVGQLRYNVNTDINTTAIAVYVRDKEVAPDELLNDGNNEDIRDGTDVVTRYDNSVLGLKADYTGLEWLDISASYYHSWYNVDDSTCDGDVNGNCRFSPLINESANDKSWFVNLDVSDFLVTDLTFNIQGFFIGADYMSVQSARREQDVLLTQGWMNTHQWGRPDYNFGNRENGNSTAGLGYGGWNGETQQVASLMADNDFTDFDEPVAYDVHGYKGITVVPKYTWNDIEFSAEYSYFDYDTNWQACGGQIDNATGQGYRTSCGKYPRNEGIHAWGLGGDWRAPYSMYQDRETQQFGFNMDYVWDIGNGIDLGLRYQFIKDDDDRVKSEAGLVDAYGDGYASGVTNPDWIPNFSQQWGDCTGCDNRKAEYALYGFSVGYQLHPDLYATILYDYWDTDLVDGTIDTAPVGLGFEGSNDFGYAEYLTGDHSKNRIGVVLNYFLSGVEFGAAADWFWGNYDPEFYVNDNGRRAKLRPTGDFVVTPLGNISTDDVDLNQYRLKAFMKVSF